MKILYVSLLPIDSNSSAMIRNNALIQGLIDLGHEVELLALSPQQKYESLNWDNRLIISLINNSGVYSILKRSNKDKLINRFKNNVMLELRKIYQFFNIYDNTFYLVKNINEMNNLVKFKHYDLIISSSDPKTSHLIVKKLTENGLKYSNWFQYWGDPLASDITRKSLHSFKRLKKEEIKLFSNSDKIIYVSPFTYKQQKKLFTDYSDRIEYLPVPYKEPIFYKKNINREKNIRLGYFGDYFKKVRNIQPLYNVAISDLNIELNIAGSSDLSLENTQNITVSKRVPHLELTQYEEKIDILVCILNNEGNQIPGKLFHYAATNKPLLVLYNKSISQDIIRFLISFNRFILCENSEDSIKTVINSGDFYKDYFPLLDFEAKTVAEKLVNLIDN